MSIYGGVLSAGMVDPLSGALHAGAVGGALYVAHLRDGYIDGHRRGEEAPRLTVPAFRSAVLTGSLVVVALSAVLFARSGVSAALSAVLLLVLALLHAPYLDRHPLTVTADYPVGIGLALLGGYAAQTGSVTLGRVGVAAAFVGLLSGIKIGIDRLDADFDRSIGKRTVPVAFGSRGSERLAVAVFGATAVTTAAVGVGSVRPTAVVAAAAVPVGCLLATVFASPDRAVRIQMALTYVFAAVLFFGVCNACIGVTVATRLLGVG
jgi:4-hydroxybenzoate polyprenyltransferase